MPDVRLDDDRLAAVLTSVGEHLVIDRVDCGHGGRRPAGQRSRTDVAPAIARRGRGPRRRRRDDPRRCPGPQGGQRVAGHRAHRGADRQVGRPDRSPFVPCDQPYRSTPQRSTRSSASRCRRSTEASSGRRAGGGRCRRAECSPGGPVVTRRCGSSRPVAATSCSRRWPPAPTTSPSFPISATVAWRSPAPTC